MCTYVGVRVCVCRGREMPDNYKYRYARGHTNIHQYTFPRIRTHPHVHTQVQRNNNAIGFCTGQFFNRQGQVIMSTSQEGLIRQRNMGYKKNHVIVPVPLTAQGSTSASARTHAQGQTAAAASGSDTCANNHNHRLKSSPPASPTVLRSKL